MAHALNWQRPASLVKMLALGAASLVLTGCACGFGDTPCVGPCEEEAAAPVPAPVPTPEPPPPPPPEPPNMRVVYFGFDNATVRDEDMSLLEQHATFLRENAKHYITIEGHCDERGPESYNEGLGLRRAQSVFNVLSTNGVPATRMTAVSFGEGKPADPSEGEEAWAKNRRAVIIYYR